MRKRWRSVARKDSESCAKPDNGASNKPKEEGFNIHSHNYHCCVCGQFMFGGLCIGGEKCTVPTPKGYCTDVYNDYEILCLACMTAAQSG